MLRRQSRSLEGGRPAAGGDDVEEAAPLDTGEKARSVWTKLVVEEGGRRWSGSATWLAGAGGVVRVLGGAVMWGRRRRQSAAVGCGGRSLQQWRAVVGADRGGGGGGGVVEGAVGGGGGVARVGGGCGLDRFGDKVD